MKWTTNTKSKDEIELIVDFGKNMLGLSDELSMIGKNIEDLSKRYRVLIRNAFIDELDDVYRITFVLFPKN